MTILAAMRDRFTTREPSGLGVDHAQGEEAGAEARLPFAGYDRLDARQAVDALSDHSQIELEAVESFERSHQNRAPVLDKLRYMRGSEPLPRYDELSAEEIVTALEGSDLATIKKVRGYERKFANRPDVLEQAARVQHRRVATRPASAAPSYQPMSATSGSSVSADRPERSGRP
jgi:hypothetical protein